MSVALTRDPLDPGAMLNRFCEGRTDIGAVVSFTGVCRSEAGAVTALELDAYPGFTEPAIETTVEEAKRRFGAAEIVVTHRIGRIAPGEAIVFVAAAAAHRRAAFQAADFLMDYLKSRAPFWKKSVEADGERWIDPTALDYEDTARWDAPVGASE